MRSCADLIAGLWTALELQGGFSMVPAPTRKNRIEAYSPAGLPKLSRSGLGPRSLREQQGEHR